MKKNIPCIIISFIFLSHTVFYAQETTATFLKTTETVSNSEAYVEPIDGISWKVSDKYIQDINHDFYKNGAAKTIAFRNENTNYLPTTNALNPKNSNHSEGFIVSDNSESAALLKPCSTFIVTTSSLLAIIIALIIVTRIKTNTLKLF